ncbi:MAG TPA: Ig-like domain-containing protein, partial [Holophagaceae bacterium]|nr:Ig-like domain-containing protein [Holophagaceae bacterium]
MRHHSILGALSLLSFTLAASPAAGSAGIKAGTGPMPMPLSFVQNEGQSASSAKFLVSGPRTSMALGSDGIRLSIRGGRAEGRDATDPVSLRFLGADARARLQGEDLQATRTNVFTGSDPSKWLKDIPTFSKARYEGVYPGTDLLCYGTEGKLEYDWILSPGADPSRIRVAMDGVRALRVDAKGNLVGRTAHGEVLQSRPVAYQMVGGERRPVLARFNLGKDRRVGFTLGAYDPSKELVIDPVLSWTKTIATGSEPNNTGGTYSIYSQGGVAVAPNGDVITAWADYTTPVGGGSYTSYVHVQRRSSDGNTTVYTSTFGGGTFVSDSVEDLAVDASGNAYVLGSTNDPNFPHTTGTLSSNTTYVLKVNATGGTAYSSLLNSLNSLAANNSSTVASSIAVDSAGAAFICGTDYSETLPSTTGSFQPSHANDDTANGLDGIGNPHGDDGWVAKLDASTGAITRASYLGGDDWDSALGLSVDGSGNVLVAGETCSSNLATGGAYKTTHPNDVYDVADGLYNYSGFVAKLSNDLSSRTWCTYLGGSGGPSGGTVGYDTANVVAADSSGNVFAALEVDSTDLPLSAGAAQGAHGNDGGGRDIYIAKFSSDGTTLSAGTYLGGDADDAVDHIAVDAAGTVFVTGFTGAPVSPATPDFPSVHALYSYDATNGSPFLVRLSADEKTVDFATSLSSGTAPIYGHSAVLGFGLNPATGTAYVGGVDATFNEAAFNLAAFGNAAPTAGAAGLGSIQQGGNITITYAALATASGAADVDGDPVTFHPQAINSGTLTDSGTPVTLGSSQLAPGGQWVWTPDPAGHGAPLSAFTFSSYDGHQDSSTVQATAVVNGAPSITDLSSTTVTAELGSGASSQPFTVSDAETAAGSLGVTAASSNTALVTNGNLSVTNTSGSCSVSMTPVAGATGSSTITLNVTDGSGGSTSTAFTYTVQDTTGPTASCSVTGSKGKLHFDASASDPSSVTQVEFYVDGVIKARDLGAPYGTYFDSTTIPDGTHALTVKAYDTFANVTTSAPASFTIDNTPPAVSASITGTGGKVHLDATATDANGVPRVKFIIDGTVYAADTSAPYGSYFNSTLLADGPHSLVAEATDAYG